MTVFLVQHVHYFNDTDCDIKLIGIFSSREKALKVIDHHGKLPGFKEFSDLIDPLENTHLSGFYMDEYHLDAASWNEGFETE